MVKIAVPSYILIKNMEQKFKELKIHGQKIQPTGWTVED